MSLFVPKKTLILNSNNGNFNDSFIDKTYNYFYVTLFSLN